MSLLKKEGKQDVVLEKEEEPSEEVYRILFFQL
jgi:hypothetical protein